MSQESRLKPRIKLDVFIKLNTYYQINVMGIMCTISTEEELLMITDTQR